MNAGWFFISVWIRYWDPIRPYWLAGRHVAPWWQTTNFGYSTAADLAVQRAYLIYSGLEPVNDRVEVTVSRYSNGQWGAIRRFAG